MPVQPVPEGYHTVTPYLIIDGAGEAIEFYKRAFGAVELFRMEQPDGKVGHAEIRIGDSVVMLADEYPERGFRGPASLGGSPIVLHLYVEDVDRLAKQSQDAGAEIIYPVKDQFYGDRTGTLRDPFGHVWSIATHVEDVSPEELKRRAKEHRNADGAG